jgi:hypothetical protein
LDGPLDPQRVISFVIQSIVVDVWSMDFFQEDDLQTKMPTRTTVHSLGYVSAITPTSSSS